MNTKENQIHTQSERTSWRRRWRVCHLLLRGPLRSKLRLNHWIYGERLLWLKQEHFWEWVMWTWLEWFQELEREEDLKAVCIVNFFERFCSKEEQSSRTVAGGGCGLKRWLCVCVCVCVWHPSTFVCWWGLSSLKANIDGVGKKKRIAGALTLSTWDKMESGTHGRSGCLFRALASVITQEKLQERSQWDSEVYSQCFSTE